MIRIPSPIPEPPGFHASCRLPGRAWLAANPPPAEVSRDFWSPFRDDLALGFAHRCGYLAMWISEGTVDHFLSRKNHRMHAYEWDNYRFISHAINSSKRNLDGKVLDPFEVGDGWFEVSLPDLQLRLTANIPADKRAKAAFTVERFRLDNGPRIMKQRRLWYHRYRNGMMGLPMLHDCAPLIARAVDRWVQTDPRPLPAAVPPW